MKLGLDLWRWENGDYPNWFKARALAFYGLYNLVDAVGKEVAQMEVERRSKQ